MKITIYPKIKYRDKEYGIYGSDGNLGWYWANFEDRINRSEVDMEHIDYLYKLGVSVQELNWKYHGKKKFEPVDKGHKWWNSKLEEWADIELNIITFNTDVTIINPTGWFGIGLDQKWRNINNIEDFLLGSKYLISDEFFKGLVKEEEDCGYTEGYKLGYSGLKWL